MISPLSLYNLKGIAMKSKCDRCNNEVNEENGLNLCKDCLELLISKLNKVILPTKKGDDDGCNN